MEPIETMPAEYKDGREVLLKVPNRRVVGHYRPGGFCIEDFPTADDGFYFLKPTHWSPLEGSDPMKEMMSVMAAVEANPGMGGAPTGVTLAIATISKLFGNDAVQKTTDAVVKARAAAVPWATILLALLPVVMSIFVGGKVDIQTIIAAILALIPQPVPTP